jgi:hypothetical protein
MFDENYGLLDQVIFCIAHPKLPCHSHVKDIAENRELVVLLLVRHFRKHGGLILPPLAAAVELQEAHVRIMEADIAAGRKPAMMHYPNW